MEWVFCVSLFAQRKAALANKLVRLQSHGILSFLEVP